MSPFGPQHPAALTPTKHHRVRGTREHQPQSTHPYSSRGLLTAIGDPNPSASNSQALIIGISLGVGFGVTLLVLIGMYCLQRKRAMRQAAAENPKKSTRWEKSELHANYFVPPQELDTELFYREMDGSTERLRGELEAAGQRVTPGSERSTRMQDRRRPSSEVFYIEGVRVGEGVAELHGN